MKNNKGITLIALVVTIIVLLILAGVSIAMLTGQNGILTNAQKAKDSSTAGTLEEAAKIAVGNIMTENLGWPYGEKSGNAWVINGDVDDIKEAIIAEIQGVSSAIENPEFEEDPTEENGTKYELTAEVDEKEQTIIIDLATGAVTK